MPPTRISLKKLVPLAFGIVLAFFFLAVQGTAHAAVAFDNANTMTHTLGTSTTINEYVAAGSNLVSVACVVFDDTAGGAISSVTLNGMTMSSSTVANNATSSAYTQLWYLAAPPVATDTLVVTGNSNVTEIHVNLVNFDGVNQNAPILPGSATSSTGFSASPSLTIPSAVGNLTVSCLNGGNIVGSISGTNQTSDGINNAGYYPGASDHSTSTQGISNLHTWSISPSTSSWAISGFSLSEYISPPLINSFADSPAITVPGATSTLSWNISSDTGFATTTLTPGSFSTSTLAGSIFIVNPTTTTIYTLTSVNSVGTSTATTSVYIDNQAPTTPGNLTVTTSTVYTVSLSWSSSTDDTSVSYYSIYRCLGFCTPTSTIGCAT